MKIIRKVSKSEMKKKHPHLMEALESPNADYCIECDGLRIHKNGKCSICGTIRKTK